MTPPYLSKWFWITITAPFAPAVVSGGWWWWVAIPWAVFNIGWMGGILAACHTLRPHAKTLHDTACCYCGPMAEWGSCAYCVACRVFGLRAPSSYYPNPEADDGA